MPSKKIRRTWTVTSEKRSSGCFGDRYEQVELGETYELTDGRRGEVKFIGQTAFRPGPEWIGLELTSGKGKNNGVKMNVKYFECKRSNKGLFVPLSKIKRKVPKGEIEKRTLRGAFRPYLSWYNKESALEAAIAKGEASTPKSPKKSNPYSPVSYQWPVYSWQNPKPKSPTPPPEFETTPLVTRDASRNILDLENGPSVVTLGKEYVLEDGRVGKVAWIGAGWQALKYQFPKPKYSWSKVEMPQPKTENLPLHPETWGYRYGIKDVPTELKKVVVEGGELFGLVVKAADSGNVSWPEADSSSLNGNGLAPVDAQANPFQLEGLEKAKFLTDGTVINDDKVRWVFECQAGEECVFVQPKHLVEEFVTKDDLSQASVWFDAKTVQRATALKSALEAAFGQFPDVGIANLISAFEGQERIYVARGMKSYNGDCLIEKADEVLVLQPNGRAMRSFWIQYKRVSGRWGDNGFCGGVGHPRRILYGAQDGTWTHEGRHIIFDWVDSEHVEHKFAPQRRYLITEKGLQQDFSRIIDWRTTDRDHSISDECYSYNMDDSPEEFSEHYFSLQPHEGPHVSEVYEPVDAFPEGFTVLEYRGEGKGGDTIQFRDEVWYTDKDGDEIHGKVEFLGFVDKALLPEGFPEGPYAALSNLTPNKYEPPKPKYYYSYTPEITAGPGDFLWFDKKNHFVSKKKKGRYVPVKDLRYVLKF